MDPLPGPVPYLHKLFSGAKGPLQEDFPFPGTAKISTDNQLVGAGEKKFGALSLDYEGDLNGKETNVSAFVKLRCPWDTNFYGGWQVSTEKGFNPVAQFACPSCPSSIAVDKTKAVYHYAHPTFSFRARSNFWEGLSINASGVTYLGNNYYAGMLIDYDALRSGLRKSLLVFNHGFGTSCDTTVSVNGRSEIGFTWNKEIATNTNFLLDVLPADDIAVAGLKYSMGSGDNAKSILLRADVLARTLGAALNFSLGGWNYGVSVSVDEKDVKSKSYTPKIGLTFTA